ncbi:hypothetical protein COO60DRAFT_1024638 [Scenedesmus sp. NREL 46B-D3]|nr:hypothetical protein COO60DRAFT_1024638 [Scenedesmus sp. NREL 46B-D3]
MFAEEGQLLEAREAKQELQQRDAEMPLEALIASLLGEKHQLPGVETEAQLLRWLFHLQTDRGVLLPETPGAAAVAEPAAGGSRLVSLALRVMLQRLLAHRRLRAGQKLAQRAEEVLVAELSRGADRPGRLRVPRTTLQSAARLLRQEVPALQPYLLVPGFLEGWVKRELHPSFVLTDSLEQQLPAVRRLPVREVNLEVTIAAARAHGLQLRRCWRTRGKATCPFGDRCYDSHAL